MSIEMRGNCRALLVLSCLVYALCNRVIPLDSSNFHQTVNEHSLVLVDFHAPWCGHCKTLSEVLARVVPQLAEQDIHCVVGSFDVSTEENEEFIQSEQIELVGYPSLLLYKYGQKLTEYSGNRVEQDIIAFLKSKALPVATRIESFSEIEPLIQTLEHYKYNIRSDADTATAALATAKKAAGAVSEEVVVNKDNHILAIVVGCFPGGGSSAVGNTTNAFLNIAMHFDLGLFFITSNEDLLRELNVAEDSLVVFTSDRQHLKRKIIPLVGAGADGSLSLVPEDTIKRQILLECLPTAITYSLDSQPLLSSLPVREHVLLFFNKSVEAHVDFVHRVESIGAIHANGLLCIEVDVSEYQLLNFFSVRAEDIPQVVIADMRDEADMRKYSLAQFLAGEAAAAGVAAASTAQSAAPQLSRLLLEASLETLERLFERYAAKELERSLLSEDVASLASSNANVATTLVENIASINFDEKVMRPGQDSLLYVHAPWCGHCKSIEPVVSAVARQHSGNPNLKVFRIDGTRNDLNHPSVRVNGFPALFLFRGSDLQNPILYDGERTVGAIDAFINDFKTKPLAANSE